MRASPRSVRWGVGIVVAAIAAVVFSQRDARPAIAAASDDVVALEPAARQSLAPADPAAPIFAASVADARASVAMALELRDATDLRRFALAAARHPESGGLTYARYVTELCRSVRQARARHGLAAGQSLVYQAPEDPARYASRVAAAAAAETACASFTDDELTRARSSELARDAASRHDTLDAVIDQVRRLSPGVDGDARRAAVEAVLATDDPLVVSVALARAVALPSPGGRTFRIAGEPVQAEDLEAHEAALQAAACRLGSLCDARRPDVVETCLEPAEECVPDRVALLRSQLAPFQRPYFDAVLPKLEAAIRARDAAYFLR